MRTQWLCRPMRMPRQFEIQLMFPRPGCVEPVDAENVAALVGELHMPRLTWAEARYIALHCIAFDLYVLMIALRGSLGTCLPMGPALKMV